MDAQDLPAILIGAVIIGGPSLVVSIILARWTFKVNHVLARLNAIQTYQKRQTEATEALLRAIAPSTAQTPVQLEPPAPVPMRTATRVYLTPPANESADVG